VIETDEIPGGLSFAQITEELLTVGPAPTAAEPDRRVSHDQPSVIEQVNVVTTSKLPPLPTTPVDQVRHISANDVRPTATPVENRELAALPALESFLEAIEMSRRRPGP
jgi:hypothetical protein